MLCMRRRISQLQLPSNVLAVAVWDPLKPGTFAETGHKLLENIADRKGGRCDVEKAVLGHAYGLCAGLALQAAPV